MARQYGIRLVAIVALLALAGMMWWWGGPTNIGDVAVIRALRNWRQAAETVAPAAIVLTQLGSAYATIGAALLAMSALLFRRLWARAALLAGSVAGARLAADLCKQFTERPRPAFDLHPLVVTHSSSFPSGHAANSMATFLALALFAAPQRWRRPALAAAVAASLAVGLTRPILGVHWPSDVLAGWALGAAIVLAVTLLPAARRDRAAGDSVRP